MYGDSLNYQNTYIQNGQFNWSEQEQGTVLGVFYYGYIATQVYGGVMAEKYGGKWIFGIGTFATALLTLMIPMVSSGGKTAFMVIRVLQGLGEVRMDKAALLCSFTIVE